MKLTLEKIIKIYFKENTGFRGLIKKL